MLKSESINKISVALLKAQKEMGSAIKDSKNPFFKSKYADINSVREACHPALNANGITVLQPMTTHEGKSYVETILIHESGEYLGSMTEIVCAKQNDPQALGSAISYARRYSLQSLVSLGTADDDAESSMNRNTSQTIITTNSASTHLTPPSVTLTTGLSTPVKKSSFKQEVVKTKVEDNGGWE